MKAVTLMIGFVAMMFMIMTFNALLNPSSMLSNVESSALKMSDDVIEDIVDRMTDMVEGKTDQLIEDQVSRLNQA